MAAAPEKDKIQTAVNEYIRRMKNCSRELDSKEVEQVILEYSKDLRRGGFSKHWIRNVLDAASRG